VSYCYRVPYCYGVSYCYEVLYRYDTRDANVKPAAISVTVYERFP
jgi:hypothetical protein